MTETSLSHRDFKIAYGAIAESITRLQEPEGSYTDKMTVAEFVKEVASVADAVANLQGKVGQPTKEELVAMFKEIGASAHRMLGEKV